MLLREALISAMKRKRTDEGRSDAVLKVLGLEEDTCIVDMSDLAHLLAYVEDATTTLDNMGCYIEDENGNRWDADQIEHVIRIRREFFATLSDKYVRED